MSVDLERLYPGAEAQEMLAILGNSGAEIGALRGPVAQGTARVRDMLGEYTSLAAAVGRHARVVAHLGDAQRLIEAAGPVLADAWNGDAYRAYQGYEATVLGQAAGAVRQARQVAAVIAEIHAVVAAQYQAAASALATMACHVVGLAGGRGHLSWRLAGELTRRAYAFVSEVDERVQQVVEALDGGRERIARVSAAATPAPPGPGEALGGRPAD